MQPLKILVPIIGILMFAAPALAQVSDDYGTADSGSYCPKLSLTMQRGARDVSYKGQVSELQKFIADYYDIDPDEIVTGFFGRITQGYVQQFQREHGLPTFGIAGSMTRAAIAKACTSNTFSGTDQTNPNTPSTTPTAPSTSYVPVPTTSTNLPTPVVSVNISPVSVTAGQSSLLYWNSTNAIRCVLKYGSSEENISVSGLKTVTPSQTTTYLVWCANDPGNGKDGPAASKSVTLSVSSAPAPVTPTISFQTSPATILAGQVSTLSWTSSNANRCYLQSNSPYEPWQETVALNGSKTVTPSQTTSYRLWCSNDPGTGKDGPSAEKSVSVNVSYPQQSYDGSEAVQVNISSLYTNPGKPFTIIGSVSPSVVPITIALVEIKYAGSTDWGAVSQLVKDGSGYLAVSNSASVSGGNWSASFGGLPEGYYHILIYDASFNLKGSGFLVSTWKG